MLSHSIMFSSLLQSHIQDDFCHIQDLLFNQILAARCLSQSAALRCTTGASESTKTSNHHGNTSEHPDDPSAQQSSRGEQQDPDDIKNRILNASLPHVHTLGWTTETIAAGIVLGVL